MQNSVRIFLSVALVLLFAAVSGCGGTAVPAGAPSQISGSVTRAELLSDLDKLEPGAGVSADSFASVKGALKAVLTDSLETKFTVHPPHGPHSTVTDLTLAILPDGSDGIQWTYVNPGDYNFDGQVNLHDLVNLAAFLGATSTSANWDKAQFVDGDGNGAITIADITPIAANFLGTVTAWQIEGSVSEEGPWEILTSVPLSSQEKGDTLTPPSFVASIGNGSTVFKITALDPQAEQGQSSEPSQALILTPQVVLCDGPDQPQIEAFDGQTARLNADEQISLNAGDVLVGKQLLKVDELVAGGNEVQAKVTPANLSQVFKSGVLDIGSSSLPEGTFETDIDGETRNWTTLSGVDVAVSGLALHYHPTVHLRASYEAQHGLSHASLEEGGNLDFAADISLDAAASAYLNQGGEAEIPLIGGGALYQWTLPSTNMLIPVWVEKKATLAIYGNGALAGQSLLHYSLHASDFGRVSKFDPSTNTWSETTTASLSSDGVSDPQLNVSPHDGDCTIYVVLKLTHQIYLFPGSPLENYFPEYQSTLTGTVTNSSSYGGLGRNFTESWSLSNNFSPRLDRLGLPNLVVDTGSYGIGAQSIRSGFIADPPPVTTRTVIGTVYDGSSPLSSVEITVRDTGTSEVLGNVATNGEGSYEIAGLPDGANVTVTAALEGYTFTSNPVELILDSDKTADFFGSPVSPQTYGISGYLTDSQEFMPIVGAQVYLCGPGGIEQLAQTETDGSGHYSFGGISPFSTVRVVPSMSGYGFVPSFAEFTVTGEMGQDFTGNPGG